MCLHEPPPLGTDETRVRVYPLRPFGLIIIRHSVHWSLMWWRSKSMLLVWCCDGTVINAFGFESHQFIDCPIPSCPGKSTPWPKHTRTQIRIFAERNTCITHFTPNTCSQTRFLLNCLLQNTNPLIPPTPQQNKPTTTSRSPWQPDTVSYWALGQ